MLAVDTNILARFYVDDPNDPEAARQRPVARAILMESRNLFVPVTVVLELEWVLRAFYRFTPAQVTGVLEHLLGLEHVSIEHDRRVAAALPLLAEGMDFADALHLMGIRHCDGLLTFDDRRFARRAARLGCEPPVQVPAVEEHPTTD